MLRRCTRGSRRMSGPNSTFPIAVRQGNSAYSWNTTPRSGDAPLTCAPSTRTRPAVGCTKPAIIPSSVDLPQPDGPSRHVKLFSASSRFTWLSAVISFSKVIETPSIRILVRAAAATVSETWFIASAPRRLAPAQEPRLEEAQQPVEGEADQSDHRRPEQHLRDEKEGPGIVDQVAKSCVGGDELRRHDDEKRQTETQPQPGDDRRRGGGQHDIAEQVAPVRAETLGSAQQQRVDVFDALERGGEDRKECRIGDEGDLGCLADAEPQHHHRQE